jgi:hypothetical protein
MSTIEPVETSESISVRCARHPNVETVLRCGRCDTPICPKCLISTPVGARCATCAQVKRFALLVKPRELAAAAGLGLGVAAVGSLVLSFIPFLGLFGLAILGFVVGEAVSIGANRKRARELGPLAVGCLVVGYALGPLLAALLTGRVEVLLVAPAVIANTFAAMIRAPLLLIGLGVGALLAWMRVR